METQSLTRVSTVCDPPPPRYRNDAQMVLDNGNSQHSEDIDIYQATQSLPRTTALARRDSSFAFSSIFNPKTGNAEMVSQENGINESVDQVRQLLDDVPISSAPGPSQPIASPILDYSQIERTVVPKDKDAPVATGSANIPPVLGNGDGTSNAQVPSSSQKKARTARHSAQEVTRITPGESSDTASCNVEISTSGTGVIKGSDLGSDDALSSLGGGTEQGALDCDCGNNDDGNSNSPSERRSIKCVDQGVRQVD